MSDNLLKIISLLEESDIKFLAATDKNVKNAVKATKKKLIKSINKLILNLDKNSIPIKASDTESAFDKWKIISDVLDGAFEKSDKLSDISKRETLKRKRGIKDDDEYQYLQSNDISIETASKKQKTDKPQLQFKTPVDNSDKGPFKPKLKEKPFALVPLNESIKLVPETEDVPSHYPNPYETEIMGQEYNRKTFEIEEPIPSKDWNTTKAIWVATIAELSNMIDDLKNYTEIAVDLEHHDLRSYYGLTCLMQISTREQDYIIDTLVLRDDLYALNEVFCNPEITKVLHGAFMDIIWLQRDFGVYVVSLFDTYHASRSLGFAKHGLAFLLENFAKFKTSKMYQLSDWRQRPLSEPLMAYARSDTHFLLNIFDQLRNKLLESNKMEHVLEQSRNVAKRRFENNTYRPRRLTSDVYSVQERHDPWLALSRNYNLSFSLDTLVKELYLWRDKIAREEDESPRFVMNNQLLVNLVTSAPTDVKGILSTPGQKTPFVIKNINNLAQVINSTISKMKHKPSTKSDQNIHQVNYELTPYEVSNSDLTNTVESFKSLTESITKNATKAHASMLNNSCFLLSNIKEGIDSKFVFYSESGDKVYVTKDEYEEREQSVDEEFKLTMKLNDSVVEQLMSTVDNVEDTVVENKEQELSDHDENVDEEVVVLDQRRVEQRKQAFDAKTQKKLDEMSDDVLPLDFNKGPKMLVDPEYKKSKKKGKKNNKNNNKNDKVFNPYEKRSKTENKAFNLTKKNLARKKPGSGKSISFKK